MTGSRASDHCGGRILDTGNRDSCVILYEVSGDGFLRHMVRAIVGSLVEVGDRAPGPRWIRQLLQCGCRRCGRSDSTRARPVAGGGRVPEPCPISSPACKIRICLPGRLMSLEQVLAWVQPGSAEESLARQVDFGRLPAHVAIIMDGNGRWAAQRQLPRVEGHRAGIDAVRDVVETSARLGMPVLTLYAFSVENWKRPRAEVSHADDAAEAVPQAGAGHAARERHPVQGDRPRGRARSRRARRARAGHRAHRGQHAACSSTSR